MTPPAATIRSPKHLTVSELDAFKQLVIAGGEVDPVTLPALISRALCLALIHNGAGLVGVGALKKPNKNYRNRVFENAGIPQKAEQFKYELGWVYVVPTARGKGLAKVLVKKLVAHLKGTPAYATSRIDNLRMHATLEGAGFSRSGNPYPSKINPLKLQLFLRE